jgi:nicotinate-nucleotide adenylyltransferase
VLDFPTRFRLAERAFAGLPRTEVVAEEHRYTADAVRGGRFADSIFLVGADEFANFLSWKDPNGVLEEVRLGVATRPGFPPEALDPVLERPDRVQFFDMPELPISGTEIRARAARGEPVDELVPLAVAAEIERLGLYR